jgi:hypothetical protein
MNDQTLNLWRQIEQSRRWGKRRLMPSVGPRLASPRN